MKIKNGKLPACSVAFFGNTTGRKTTFVLGELKTLDCSHDFDSLLKFSYIGGGLALCMYESAIFSLVSFYSVAYLALLSQIFRESDSAPPTQFLVINANNLKTVSLVN